MGARRPVSTGIVGVTLIVFAVALGDAGLAIRYLVPMPFFGLLLLFVGVQHARLALDVQSASDIPFVALAGALAVAFDGNLAYAGGLTLLAWYLARGLLHAWHDGAGALSSLAGRPLRVANPLRATSAVETAER
jgi:hypothetical protein